MAGYKYGIYISEKPTSITPPVTVDSAVSVFFVTAPLHLAKEPYNITNIPKLCYTYDEAVEAFGFSLKPEIWNKYTACEAIYSQFALYAVAPVVIVNVLDPKVHIESVTDEKVILNGFTGILGVDGVLIDTVKIKKQDDEYYEQGTHFTLAFDSEGLVNINAKKGISGGIPENDELELSYTKLAPEKVDIYDVIGGYDVQTGKYIGLELVNEIYPRFRIVPGQLVVPFFSADPAIAAIMETKASNINGHFRCIAINDLPTMIEGESEPSNLRHLRYTDVPAWKNDNNYTSERQVNCYPKVRMGEQIFNYSTQMACLICRTDADNGGVPYVSPGNKSLKINGLCYADGTEVIMNPEQANYLVGQGIATATNFTKGFTAWGHRTGIYPGNTDAKESFIPLRRMFDWIGNSIVLTYWNKIEYPLTKRTIKTIVDSINIWFNGLASREYILGGRIEFVEQDNSMNEIIDGNVAFRVKIAPPPPMKSAEFILEYDPSYLKTLFATS